MRAQGLELMGKLLIFSLFVLGACLGNLGGCASGPIRPANSRLDIGPRALASLVLPPTPATSGVLQRLDLGARRGKCEFAARHLRYLIDLLDYVRIVELPGLTEKRTGHALLWRALSLGDQPSRGRSATKEVMTALGKRIALGKSRCSHSIFREAEILIHADTAARRTARDRLAATLAYKRIILSTAPAGTKATVNLQANAQLRLIDWCYQAFRLAAGGEPSRQARRINQCLYPLFEADPAPYFQPKAVDRPPDPPWAFLRDTLLARLDSLKEGRLQGIAAPWLRSVRTFFSMVAAELPSTARQGRFDLLQISAKQSKSSFRVWDRHPILAIDRHGFAIDNIAVIDGDDVGLASALKRRLYNDPRGKITVLAPPNTLSERLIRLAKPFRNAGVNTLYLALLQPVATKAPAGDVHAGLSPKGPVLRLAGIPLSLALFPSRRSLRWRGNIRGLDYSWADNRAQLKISISSKGLTISTKHGMMHIDEAKLAASICSLRKAYPADQGVILAVTDGTPISRLTQIAMKTRVALHQCGFLALAFARQPRGDGDSETTDLSPLLPLLSSANVTKISPTGPSATHTPDLAPLKRCYRATLIRRSAAGKGPLLRGTIKLQLGRFWRVQRSAMVVKDRKFRKCIAKALREESQIQGRTQDPPPKRGQRCTVEFSASSDKVRTTFTVGKD